MKKAILLAAILCFSSYSFAQQKSGVAVYTDDMWYASFLPAFSKPVANKNPEDNLKRHSSGTWNANTDFKIEGGQSIKFMVKNVNVLGTTLTISTNHGDPISKIILPQSTASFQFYVFGEEPTPWNVSVSTNSDAFIVAWTLYSTWIPGDPKNGK